MATRKREGRKTDNYSFQTSDPKHVEWINNQENLNKSIRKLLDYHITKYGYADIEDMETQFRILQDIMGAGPRSVEQVVSAQLPQSPSVSPSVEQTPVEVNHSKTTEEEVLKASPVEDEKEPEIEIKEEQEDPVLDTNEDQQSQQKSTRNDSKPAGDKPKPLKNLGIDRSKFIKK